jgi:hypothetical protein
MIKKIEDTQMDSRAFGNYGATLAWAEDFIYAVEERPWLFKLLFRLAVGKFAWREFMGMAETLIMSGGFYPKHVGYSHREQEYHKDNISLWDIK